MELSRFTVTPGVNTDGTPNYTFQTATTGTVSDLDWVASAVALNNSQTGCQEFGFLHAPEMGSTSLNLSVVSLGGNTFNIKNYPLTSIATVLVDYLPTAIVDSQVQLGPLLLAGLSDSTLQIFTFDTTTEAGTLAGPWTLSVEVGSTLVSGHLVRQDLGVCLVLLTAVGTELLTLNARSIPLTALDEAPGPLVAVAPVAVGTIPGDYGRVSATVTKAMQADCQQLAVAFMDASATATPALPALGLLSYDSNGNLSLLQKIDVSIANVNISQDSIVCVAASDFADVGLAQIVVGFQVDVYGGVPGCIALALAKWDTSTNALVKTSDYICTSPDTGSHLAGVDMQIAAGIFWANGPKAQGGTMGVAIMGRGGTLKEIDQDRASVVIDVIPVSPNLLLPSYGATPALLGSTALKVDVAALSQIFGFGVDFSGLSVVLGPPTIQSIVGYSQILAIIGAPPYSAKHVGGTAPKLTFSEQQSQVVGVTINNTRGYTVSDNTSEDLHVGGFDWSNSIENTYGDNFSQTIDSSITKSLTLSIVTQLTDLMLVYAMDYTAWHYPVYQVSSQGTMAAGSILVIFPNEDEPTLKISPAYSSELNTGYVQPYENGRLLSYANLVPDGFSPSEYPNELLFQKIATTIVSDPGGGTTLTYDSNTMTTNTTSGEKTVTTNLSDSESLTAATSLFNFLPISFGMSLTDASNYTQTTVNTTNMIYSKDMSIMIVLGSVDDDSMSYDVTPLIYQHPALGCLYVGYEVDNLGPGWAEKYSVPAPTLVRPFRSSTDLVLAAYSPSITFSTISGGIQINIHVFNESFTQATNVVCTAYPGLPDISSGSAAPPNAPAIGSYTLEAINALARQTAEIRWLSADGPVTVVIAVNGTQADIAWTAYPLSDAGNYVTAEVQ